VFSTKVNAILDGWMATHAPLLRSLKKASSPKEIIETLSETLLESFSTLSLLDKYDVYQRFMSYWDEVMQDDVYLIATDGWVEAAKPRAAVDEKDKKIKETPDLILGKKKYKMDLVPPALLVARYFAAEQDVIDSLEAKAEVAARELEEFVDVHAGEDGILEDLKNDKGRIPKAALKERIKTITDDPESVDDCAVLTNCLALVDSESEASRAVKGAREAFDAKTFAQYPKLTEADIKDLVVDAKWLSSLAATIAGEVQRLAEVLAGRLKRLEERYAKTLPELEQEVDALTGKVEEHLKQMGLTWA